jgi:hypothetical protein
VKMGLDDAGCAYSPGAEVCERDLLSSDCLRLHFSPPDSLKSGSFPYWVKGSGKSLSLLAHMSFRLYCNSF